MTLKHLVSDPVHFRTAEQVREEIESLCHARTDLATFRLLGNSEAGRPVYGVELGSGKRTVSLMAGAHADEPVGPETLRTFILQGLQQRQELADLFEKFRFVIIPHVNPDGEAKNQAWISHWPDLRTYLEQVLRELPGRDVEFGFPAMRVENQLVAEFLARNAPLSLHMSLHGMGFSDGLMLLIERHWIEKTAALRKAFTEHAAERGFHLYDNDRKGEKGFEYIGPGFTTTPRGEAMRAHFLALGDPDTANLFHDSSMEFVRKLGGDPLCVVTEFPLFLLQRKSNQEAPGVPAAYLAFKRKLQDFRAGGQTSFAELTAAFQLAPLDLKTQIELQLMSIELALACITDKHNDSRR